MKYLLAPFVLFVALAVLALPTPPPTGRLVLSWDYDEGDLETNLLFTIYWSTNAGIPMTNWTVLNTVVGTNAAKVQVKPGANFFSVTASNLWGESPFSEVASTPALPRTDSKIRITRVIQ